MQSRGLWVSVKYIFAIISIFKITFCSFTKLIELFDALSSTVQVMGEGNKRTITLTHRAQVRRFTTDLCRVIKTQNSKQMMLSEFPSHYEKVFGKFKLLLLLYSFNCSALLLTSFIY